MYVIVQSVMKTQYKQVGYYERVRLALLLGAGLGVRAIARELGRSPSTILREIRRNFPRSGKGDYLALNAENKAVARRKIPRVESKISDPIVGAYVREKLRMGWSPELLAGRMRIELPGHSVSYESIYYHVYHKERELITFLARSHRHRRPRKNLRTRRGPPIPDRICITERPDAANGRTEFGHWEVDTMLSSLVGKAAIVVVTERKSRFTKIKKLRSKSSFEVEKALLEIFSSLPPNLRKTFTYDNGPENSRHTYVNNQLGTSSFFCHAYHSWEKGTVENTISLIRRFIPSASNLDPIPELTFLNIENWLNSRPRKCLNFSSPYEILALQSGVALGI